MRIIRDPFANGRQRFATFGPTPTRGTTQRLFGRIKAALSPDHYGPVTVPGSASCQPPVSLSSAFGPVSRNPFCQVDGWVPNPRLARVPSQ
ncbi:hypothetical protein BEL01nite_12020 [Bradyrhizobium elkanii]|nr:hypothetical protein BEL01nite_12020 [Bradyrhizobium elkanii]